MTKSKTRNAITATFVVTYFLLLGLFVFFKGRDTKEEVGAITDTLVTNFTILMGVVIAFHFGTNACEKEPRFAKPPRIRAVRPRSRQQLLPLKQKGPNRAIRSGY
jgi:hypothetical protein